MTDKGTETENSTVLQRSYDISPFILKSLYNFLWEDYIDEIICLIMLKFLTLIVRIIH